MIVPLEYQIAGGPPAAWFIHDLMAAMQLPYYVGILTAAALHGASHQQPQEFQVITDRSVRPLTVGTRQNPLLRQPICGESGRHKPQNPNRHHTRSDTRDDGGGLGTFSQGCRESGQCRHRPRGVGLVARSEETIGRRASSRRPAQCQCLGYLLDRADARHVSGPLHGWIERQSCHPVPLQAGRPVGRPEDRRWHVLVNEAVEAEA